MVRPIDRIARVPFLVGADENSVLRYAEPLLQRDHNFRGRYRQLHFQCFVSAVVQTRLRRDPHVFRVLHQPFRRHLVHRRVALEVIRQNHGGVVADASVARVACSDSDICWRCCWCCARSEKCDYRRKRHKPGTSNYCEPHECVCVAKSAPQRVATDTNVGFYFPPGERDSGLADYSSTPAFVNLGRYDTAVGTNAGANLTTGSDNIDIDALGFAGESNTMRIGTVKQTATFITGIHGAATANANAVPVVIDSAGQLGTICSSRRFKDEIKPMDNSSEAILGLKAVTFHYKSDSKETPQFGLIAEEVAKVNPDLVVRDENGVIYTVRYDAVNAILLNEFLKEHRKVRTLEDRLGQQQKRIEALTAHVRKVSERVELRAPAPQIAANED